MDMLGFGERLVFSATPGTKRVGPFGYLRARIYLHRHARGVKEHHRRAANLLLERLLIDGLEHRIQVEDIERLASTGTTPEGKSPEFMRKIVVELMVCLRPKD